MGSGRSGRWQSHGRLTARAAFSNYFERIAGRIGSVYIAKRKRPLAGTPRRLGTGFSGLPGRHSSSLSLAGRGERNVGGPPAVKAEEDVRKATLGAALRRGKRDEFAPA